MNRLALLTALLIPALARADEPKELLARAEAAMKAREDDDALKLVNEALRADPKLAGGYHLRGVLHFRAARIKESLADFDRQIELDAKAAGEHWQRGLTLYYAEKYADGAAQFVSSGKAEPDDVENAIWHFLCNAKVKGVEKARGEFLKVTKDERGKPMMTIYEMFKGDAKPDDVFAAADAGPLDEGKRNSQRFYANYYVGMYYEAVGEPAKALEYLKKAVEKYPVGDYMMDVARVHLKLREKK
jgi:lipoprotein NlpI